MVERWSVVSEAKALSCAGSQAEVLAAGNVTYVIGSSATVVIVEAVDRPEGGAVQSADALTLREPFPEAVEARLGAAVPPKLGFVRVPEGYLPLGTLTQAVSHYRPVEVDGRPWPYGGPSQLTWCEFRIEERLPFDVLDRVRPTAPGPLAGIDWLRLVSHDRIAAMNDFIAGWYADVPPVDQEPGDPGRALPEPLLAFYRAAAGRPEVHGVQDSIYPIDELEDEDDGRVQFGAENQGVFVVLMDPTQPDPPVQYEGVDTAQEPEPLSTFLLRFLLLEASWASPYGGFATVTAEQAHRLVEPLHPVPLQPMRWPGSTIRYHVAPGLAVTTMDGDDGSVEVYAGSRHRSALRTLREPDFAWDHFTG